MNRVPTEGSTGEDPKTSASNNVEKSSSTFGKVYSLAAEYLGWTAMCSSSFYVVAEMEITRQRQRSLTGTLPVITLARALIEGDPDAKLRASLPHLSLAVGAAAAGVICYLGVNEAAKKFPNYWSFLQRDFSWLH